MIRWFVCATPYGEIKFRVDCERSSMTFATPEELSAVSSSKHGLELRRIAAHNLLLRAQPIVARRGEEQAAFVAMSTESIPVEGGILCIVYEHVVPAGELVDGFHFRYGAQHIVNGRVVEMIGFGGTIRGEDGSQEPTGTLIVSPSLTFFREVTG
ncbi:MAG: hypothetical protein KDD69_01780 [Bdellovibrionales bacterium]|nr:hypothetical protein [Bdellovibrionales bacterium]